MMFMNENWLVDMIDENFSFRTEKSNEYKFIEYIHENGLWDFFLDNCEFQTPITIEFKNEFHLFWIEQGENIRRQINNDRRLVEMLWKVLPLYNGKELTLYRGENIQRYKQGEIGLCWTPDLKIAKRFSTRNACEHGSVILSAKVNHNAIIAGIHSHSKYLGENEFTVDPFKIKDIKIE